MLYLLYGKVGGHQGRSERARKNLNYPGIRSRTVQSVASHYNDYIVPAIYSKYRSSYIQSTATCEWDIIEEQEQVQEEWRTESVLFGGCR